jgi:hypothetical protein
MWNILVITTLFLKWNPCKSVNFKLALHWYFIQTHLRLWAYFNQIQTRFAFKVILNNKNEKEKR